MPWRAEASCGPRATPPGGAARRHAWRRLPMAGWDGKSTPLRSSACCRPPPAWPARRSSTSVPPLGTLGTLRTRHRMFLTVRAARGCSRARTTFADTKTAPHRGARGRVAPSRRVARARCQPHVDRIVRRRLGLVGAARLGPAAGGRDGRPAALRIGARRRGPRGVPRRTGQDARTGPAGGGRRARGWSVGLGRLHLSRHAVRRRWVAAGGDAGATIDPLSSVG